MFDNTVKVEWLEHEPRAMKLLETVIFADILLRDWVAPAGSVIDGASIPRFAWRVVGSPFVGKYRRASVIHDVYCVTKDRPWQEVHMCFHRMMLADGVPKFKAWLMFKAVYHFGPRWKSN